MQRQGLRCALYGYTHCGHATMFKNLIIATLLATLVAGGSLTLSTIARLNQALSAAQFAAQAKQLQHRKQLVRSKLKERGKRLLAAVPVVGLAALGWFEKREYEEWQLEHPHGTFDDYAREMLAVAEEIAQDYLAQMRGQTMTPTPSRDDEP